MRGAVRGAECAVRGMQIVSPALIMRLNDLPLAARDRLVARLAEHDLVAIHEDDLTSPKVWIAHFATTESRDEAAAAIDADGDFAVLDVEPSEVEDDDWARRTQADLPAIQIGRVTVAPPWDLPSPEPRAPSSDPHGSHPPSPVPHPDIVVIIEPSRGFGTGHHQSTRLCIALLQNRNLAGQTMIDVGTGSGVLAITAAKLGAAYVAAIDVDPDAVENARENIAANAVGEIVEAHVEDFITANRSPADIVTANLTGTLLARHATDLARFVRSSGALVVSGFNVEEKDLVEQAFGPDLAITESAEEDGWWAFVLSRSPALPPSRNASADSP